MKKTTSARYSALERMVIGMFVTTSGFGELSTSHADGSRNIKLPDPVPPSVDGRWRLVSTAVVELRHGGGGLLFVWSWETF